MGKKSKALAAAMRKQVSERPNPVASQMGTIKAKLDEVGARLVALDRGAGVAIKVLEDKIDRLARRVDDLESEAVIRLEDVPDARTAMAVAVAVATGDAG